MDHLLASMPALAACAIAFVFGGVVKGVISVGLPMVGLPLLTLVVDVPTAVGLLLVPVFASNLLQAIEGKNTVPLLRRFWLLSVGIAIGIFTGTAMLARLDPKLLLLAVGAFSIAASLTVLLKPNLTIPPRAERWLALPVGLAAGVIGGMSTLFGPILTVFVIGLKPTRDEFVKAISLLYTIAASCLLIGGISHGAAGTTVLIASALCMIPVYAGMLIGRRIREHIDPTLFYRLVLGTVLLGGANMVRQGLGF
jgi:uncharacterized protein